MSLRNFSPTTFRTDPVYKLFPNINTDNILNMKVSFLDFKVVRKMKYL